MFRVLGRDRSYFNYRIRNYMSKPWFLKIAMESEPTPLAATIAQILKESPASTQNGSAVIDSVHSTPEQEQSTTEVSSISPSASR